MANHIYFRHDKKTGYRGWRVKTPTLNGKITCRCFKSKCDAKKFLKEWLKENKESLEKQKKPKACDDRKGTCPVCNKSFTWNGYYEKNYCSRNCASLSGVFGLEFAKEYYNMSDEEKKEREKAITSARHDEKWKKKKRDWAREYRKTKRFKEYQYKYLRAEKTRERRNFLRSKERYGDYAEAHRALCQLKNILNERKEDGT